MNGRDTIFSMWKCYFNASPNLTHRFNGICDLFMSGLVCTDRERVPDFDDLEAEIDALALGFAANDQGNLATIQNDLWTMLANWWDTVAWARRGIRVSMEREDLLGDLLQDIVRQITVDFGEILMRSVYTVDVLQALIQIHTTGGIDDPFLFQRLQSNLPENVDLNTLLQYFRQLGQAHDFDDETDILLELLLEKKDRNVNRHSRMKVIEYRRLCRVHRVRPSFTGYIDFRGLNIPHHLLHHYERLFRRKYEQWVWE